MLNCFFSYLDRIQYVRHNGNVSSEAKFCCCIPQGSCLGLSLFIFYINDVFAHINNSIRVMMFADDCVLYKSELCGTAIMRNLQKGLNEYIMWGLNNNMHLNISKMKAMLIAGNIQYNLYRPLSTICECL